MKNLAILFIFLCSLSANALPLTWRADWPDCKPVESLVHRGTDVELQPVWYINGAKAATTNWTLTTYVQTNAVGQWFGPLPGAAFSHTNDVGAAFYSVMVRAQAADGGVNYTAFARFRMLDSPGFTPGELPLPAKVIDFADVTVLNPPWGEGGGGDFTTNNTVLVETIEAVAPTPGNYAAVSNAAMNAAQNATNYTDNLQEKLEDGRVHVFYAQYAEGADGIYDTDVGTFRYGYEIFSKLDAATATNAAQSAALAEKASTNDVALAPVYSQTPTFSKWTILRDGVDVTDQVMAQPTYNGDDTWSVDASMLPGEVTGGLTEQPGPDALELTWGADDGETLEPLATYTATRTRTDVIGYTLGSQTNMPLQAAGDYAQASVLADIAETATNAASTAANASAASSTNSANIATLNAQVASIGAHLNAEDAHFVSTNYDSAVRLPEAYVEIKMRDQATGSNTWITIWQEMRRWTAFVGSAFDWQTWQGFHTWATNITHELSFKADRCWGIYDSETGGYSPEGYTQISSSNILIAAGMAYQRTVTSGGAVWILRCNQGVAQMGGDTNGFFQVFDGDGVVQFEIVKGDRREVGANADGITVDNSYSPALVTIPYSILADEHPTLRICDALETANWKDETDPDCLAYVEWNGLSGNWVATVQRKTEGDKLFVKATYMAGGETYIRNAAPVSMDSIMLKGVRYYLGTATISGHTVLTLSTTAP